MVDHSVTCEDSEDHDELEHVDGYEVMYLLFGGESGHCYTTEQFNYVMKVMIDARDPGSQDCAGYWSACTSACEPNEVRTWYTITMPIGDGTPCPESGTAEDCTAGVGECTAFRQRTDQNRCEDAFNSILDTSIDSLQII
eukprot:UN32660